MKTFDVPDTIPISKIKAFLADLGIDIHNDQLIGFRAGANGVHVEFYDLDADGYRYFEPKSGEVAVHKIAVRLDRSA